MSGRRALALRSFKEEAVLARVVRSPPTLSSQSIIKQANEVLWSYPLLVLIHFLLLCSSTSGLVLEVRLRGDFCPVLGSCLSLRTCIAIASVEGKGRRVRQHEGMMCGMEDREALVQIILESFAVLG